MFPHIVLNQQTMAENTDNNEESLSLEYVIVLIQNYCPPPPNCMPLKKKSTRYVPVEWIRTQLPVEYFQYKNFKDNNCIRLRLAVRMEVLLHKRYRSPKFSSRFKFLAIILFWELRLLCFHIIHFCIVIFSKKALFKMVFKIIDHNVISGRSVAPKACILCQNERNINLKSAWPGVFAKTRRCDSWTLFLTFLVATV